MSWLWSGGGSSSTASKPTERQQGLSAADIDFKVPQIRESNGDVASSDDEDAQDDDDCTTDIPAFPALNSAQRAGGSLAAPQINTDAKPSAKLKANRKKVALQPGFSQLDWFNLKNSGADLRVSSYIVRS